MFKDSEVKEYLNMICITPEFLKKYLDLDILNRLKKIGYFCGMDYASKDIYDFKCYISRYDHIISTALLTWRYSNDPTSTIAALFHDISTPCFSHVIDYMNGDYINQESTEEKTEEIIHSSLRLKQLLKEDNIDINNIINFKKYPIVDNERPKMCTDRLDGIILTSYAWTKQLNLEEIESILNNICIYKNEENELELGFKDIDIVDRILYLNNIIDEYFHSKYDNYMMDLLSKITKYALDKRIITYDSLYYLDEDCLLYTLKNLSNNDIYLKSSLDKFLYMKKEDVPDIQLSNVKKRIINPLVNGKRYI